MNSIFNEHNSSPAIPKQEVAAHFPGKKKNLPLSARGRGMCLMLRNTVMDRHAEKYADRGMDGDTSLHLAVIEQCIRDVCAGQRSSVSAKDRSTARRYLRGPMPHADACGLNPEWIRTKLRQARINIEWQ